MRERDYSLELIRVLTTFFIVTFHFCAANFWWDSPFYVYKNGAWGTTFNTIFFILSGFALKLTYDEEFDIRKFYKKRYLSIYPTYHVAFIICFVLTVITSNTLFYGGNFLKIFLSLVAFDSYFSLPGYLSYAVVGEWFTALIVVLYILFPLINKAFCKIPVIATIVIGTLYALNVWLKFTYYIPDTSLTTALFMFWIGMLLCKYRDKLKKNYILGIAAVCVSLVLIYVEIYPFFCVLGNLLGLSLFLSVFIWLDKPSKAAIIRKPLSFLAKISYAVYIAHHFIVNRIAVAISHLKIEINVSLYYILDWVVVLAVSIALYYITSFIVRKGFRNE